MLQEFTETAIDFTQTEITAAESGEGERAIFAVILPTLSGNSV